jgi:hypothetical protein
VLRHRYAPAGSGKPPPWSVRTAVSARLTRAMTASGSLLPSLRDDTARRAKRVRVSAGVAAPPVRAVLIRSGRPTLAWSARSGLISSKSFIYHFAAKALLSLI